MGVEQDQVVMNVGSEEDNFEEISPVRGPRSVVVSVAENPNANGDEVGDNGSKQTDVGDKTLPPPTKDKKVERKRQVQQSKLANDEIFEIERQKAEEERVKAEAMLAHTEREAQIIRERMAAEVSRKKANALIQQNLKNSKKTAALSKARAKVKAGTKSVRPVQDSDEENPPLVTVSRPNKQAFNTG